MNEYFYIDNTKQQRGPVSPSQLKALNIQPQTMVWCSGMTDWVKAEAIEELLFIFSSAPQSDQPTPSIAPPQQQRGMYDSTVYGQRPYNHHNGAMGEVRPIPKTWLVESILATVFCCPPFGIVAIINANKVESSYYLGDYEGSERASKEAKKWALVSVFALIVLLVLYFAFYVIIFAGAMGLSSLQ